MKLFTLVIPLVFSGCFFPHDNFILQHEYESSSIPFPNIKKSVLIFRGFSSQYIPPEGLTIDSLNNLYFKELTVQLQQSIPELTLIKEASSFSSAEQNDNHYVLSLSWFQSSLPHPGQFSTVTVMPPIRPGLSFYFSPSDPKRFHFSTEFEIIQQGSKKLLARLNAVSDVIPSIRRDPIFEAIHLNARLLVQYIEDEGND